MHLFSTDDTDFTMFVCRKFNATTLIWNDCEVCFEQMEAPGAGKTRNLPCDHVTDGRYVIVRLNHTLCEVRVYG